MRFAANCRHVASPYGATRFGLDYNPRATRCHEPVGSARAGAPSPDPVPAMIPLLAVIALALAIGAGYAWGRRVSRISVGPASATQPPPGAITTTTQEISATAEVPTAGAPVTHDDAGITNEHARLIRSFESECAGLRRNSIAQEAAVAQLTTLAEERRGLFEALAQSRAETARYRELIIDIENDAPPPLLGGPGAPDDLKLIVGVGPVLERLLHRLGITKYRQIALWSERDIDEFDARLAEFPGRIRRDGWVTQARSLHQSTYGEPPSMRERS